MIKMEYLLYVEYTIEGKACRVKKAQSATGNTASGCHGCMLEAKGGAEACEYAQYCMAHKRQDNQSVIFEEIKKSNQ